MGGKNYYPAEAHRLFAYALLASFSIHLLGIQYFQSETKVSVQDKQETTDHTINVLLHAGLHELPGQRNTEPITQSIPSKTTARRSSTPVKSTAKPLAELNPPPGPGKILITAETIRTLLRELPGKIIKGTTDNGATVMNSSLLKTLQRAEGVSSYTLAANQFSEDSSFEAGSWTEFINISGRCFRVKKANPLEAMSRDTWYRTSCK